MLVTLLVFLVVLGVMVFVHELGHFLVAKRSGVKVEEFAFGFRPRLLARTVGETTYAINLIPLGGYVKMFGEQGNDDGPRSFKSRSFGARLAILAAGSAMNLILSWLILATLFVVGFQPFIPNTASDPFISQRPVLKVEKVLDSTPAKLGGFQEGDSIIALNGQAVNGDTEFVALTQQNAGHQILVTVGRNGQQKDISVTPRQNPPEGQGAIGLTISQSGQVKSLWYKAPAAATYETGRIIGLSAAGFVDFVGKLVVKQKVSEDATGIVGVGALTGIARRLGFGYLAQLVALISIGLAVVNLMPILPLDGGHIAVATYEKVSRRSLSARQFSLFAGFGLAFILLIFAVVTFKDIIRFDVIGRLF